MTLSDICFHSAAALCARHLSTTGRTRLRGNLLDPAKTNMFPQLNPMNECVTLLATPLTDAPLVVVPPFIHILYMINTGKIPYGEKSLWRSVLTAISPSAKRPLTVLGTKYLSIPLLLYHMSQNQAHSYGSYLIHKY